MSLSPSKENTDVCTWPGLVKEARLKKIKNKYTAGKHGLGDFSSPALIAGAKKKSPRPPAQHEGPVLGALFYCDPGTH